MVRVEVRRNPADQIIGFSAVGHADSAPYGSDVVCAAVSVLVITTVNALTDLVGVNPDAIRQGKSGRMEFLLPVGIDERQSEHVQLLLEAMVMGLGQVAQEHGEYLSLKEVTQR